MVEDNPRSDAAVTPNEPLSDQFDALRRLVTAYVRERTVDPLRGILRFVVFGVAGSLVLGAGIVLMLVGVLRLLQDGTGTTFAHHLTWLPYLITAVIAVALAGIAGARVLRADRS